MNADTRTIVDHGDPLLRIYAWYRLALSLLLLAGFLAFPVGDPDLPFQPLLYLGTTIPYAVLNLATLVAVIARPRHPRTRHLFIMFVLDIAALVLITHASGGISSGFAILLMVTVATAAIFVPGQIATLVAAVASLAVLADALLLIVMHDNRSDTLLPSGLLGMLLFAGSLSMQRLATRLRHSQQLARERAEEVLELERINRLIVQRMRTGILFLDAQDRVRIANDAASQLLNIDANATRRLLLPPQAREAMERWQEDPQQPASPVRLRENGPLVLLSFTQLAGPSEAGTLVFAEDFSQITQQAQQLKLASLGRLTASIAHEIRNPLGSISHAAQLLHESPQLPPEDARLVEIVLGNAQRTNDVIESVLTLSRGQPPRPEIIPLDDWLRHFVGEFGQHDASTAISVSTDPAASGIEVRVDPTHLHRVLTNLCENGLRYSERSTGKATLDIALWADPLSRLARVDVIDQGSGIAPGMVEHIFEPFFTTEHGGTGLGLYLARELCEANQMHLEYVDMPQGGGCFRLHFGHPQRRNASGIETGNGFHTRSARET